MIAASVRRPERFAEIFDRHAGAVHRFVGYRVRRSDVDDVVAEVFRVAFERRADFVSTASSARPWLFGIASHLARRSHRTAERGRRRAERVRRSAERPIDPVLAVEDRVDASETVTSLGAAIDALSELEREVLLMTVWDELSPSEIAAALGLPSATIRSRLFRARAALRRALVEPHSHRDKGSAPRGEAS